MLKTLTVWNFALLEHVQVEFGTGLNILTGETGAGKSILIDSLGAILGRRVSADMIRTGCEWLRVEAVFTLDDSPGLHELLAAQAIDDAEGLLIVTRQVSRNGRSLVLANGCHITLSLLKQLGALLVDIHGQNENLALLKEDSQFRLLDALAQFTINGMPGKRSMRKKSWLQGNMPSDWICCAGRIRKSARPSFSQGRMRSWKRKYANSPTQRRLRAM